MQKFFEKILWQSRFIVIFPVIASVLSAIIMIILGTYDVLVVIYELFGSFGNHEVYESFNHKAMGLLISALDDYLIGTVMLIFAAGLYELFISKIEYAESDEASAKVLIIHDLDQLKEKIAKVVIMVLIVTYFKYAIDFDYSNMLNLLYLSVGILLIAVSIYLTHNKRKPKEAEKNK